MKLVSFSIKNYRSITKAHKLPIGNLVVLIGPNNEGKSNILRALVTALRILSRLAVTIRTQDRIARGHVRTDIYDWERDYPVALQETNPAGESVFDLEFELTNEELNDFRREVKSKLTGTLPIRLEIGAGPPRFKVAVRGPGQKVLSKKEVVIARFVGRRIDHQYIPAIRSARAALEVVENMLERELLFAEADPRYQRALRRIEEVQQPILDAVSANIQQTLVQFLPDVKGVSVTIAREQRYSALRRSCKVVIDDGTPTDLELKGDGVKSLAAISLLRRASESGARGRQIILAIEEPESHLHPRAIHELRNVLYELAERYQVIITTHCPALVDRRDIKRNILVEASKAREAKSIRHIRDVLGVRTSDNL